MKQIDLVYGTAFAELAQRTFDAQFQADFPSKVGLLRFRSRAAITGILISLLPRVRSGDAMSARRMTSTSRLG